MVSHFVAHHRRTAKCATRADPLVAHVFRATISISQCILYDHGPETAAMGIPYTQQWIDVVWMVDGIQCKRNKLILCNSFWKPPIHFMNFRWAPVFQLSTHSMSYERKRVQTCFLSLLESRNCQVRCAKTDDMPSHHRTDPHFPPYHHERLKAIERKFIRIRGDADVWRKMQWETWHRNHFMNLANGNRQHTIRRKPNKNAAEYMRYMRCESPQWKFQSNEFQ